ncbi:MAG: hypothetical protein IJS28_02170 [Synergistaceae bacterium]|nr:hypothetical protein [Synergistaceae bacterium]
MTEREELRMIVDYVPDDKLGDAIVAIEDLLEFNKETEEALDEALRGENLIGPFNTPEEMMQAVLAGDDDDYD